MYGDLTRASISARAITNKALLNTISGRIVVEDDVFFGHNACVLTGTHDINQFGRARQSARPVSGRDVTIKTGA